MGSPWRSRSSAVLTTTVSRSPRCACSPWANFPPPTPPASATTPLASATAEGRVHLADAGQCLAIVRAGQPGDQRPEAELFVRPELIGDLSRRAKQHRGARGCAGGGVRGGRGGPPLRAPGGGAGGGWERP